MATYRVYYNRRREAPQIVSFDEGDQSTEINVCAVRFHRVSAVSHWDPNTPPNQDTPSFWLEVFHAVVQVREGTAHFFHDPDWRKPRIQDGSTDARPE